MSDKKSNYTYKIKCPNCKIPMTETKTEKVHSFKCEQCGHHFDCTCETCDWGQTEHPEKKDHVYCPGHPATPPGTDMVMPKTGGQDCERWRWVGLREG